MKIVVIGGTGLIGSKLVAKLRKDGHEPLAASPDTGVDTITGEGVAEALEGAQVVVDVSNAPVWDDAAVLDFFRTSTHNVLAAEVAAGVGHHVAASIVGADRLADSSYLRAKVAQEDLIKAGTIPYTILRSTQSSSSSAASPIPAPTATRSACRRPSCSRSRPMTSQPHWPTSSRTTR